MSPKRVSKVDDPRRVPDATCLACGCLCDDIVLSVSNGRIVEAERACHLGRDWFLSVPADLGLPEAAIDGRPAASAEAVERAARILADARAPIVTGLDAASVEAQRLAVTLADRLGAVLDPYPGRVSAAWLAAFQRVGRVGATLGEVRNRADVVVFWHMDPVTTHPRHLERYSVEPRGRFVPDGRAGRTVLVADSVPTATAAQADDFLRIDVGRQFAVLSALRALVRGLDLDPVAVHAATGVEAGQLRAWADRLVGARYAAVFHGSGTGRPADAEALLRLVRDLNDVTRCVTLPMGGPGNPAGAEAVACWQTGFAQSIDFARGYPRFLPGEATAEARLARGAADAALVVGPVDPGAFSVEARAHLERIPVVRIAPNATACEPPCAVALASAATGLHGGGTVVRADGAWLPLRPALHSPWPTVADWLERLLNQLDSTGGS